MVEILYFAAIKDITQKDKEFLDFDKIQIGDIVHWLIRKYQPLGKILWDDDSLSLKRSISIAINHKIIQNKDLLSIELAKGDKIGFIQPVSGG
ncbi:MAG: MoaD/ThiS family protein [Promethearchaeota archaeon]